MDVATIVDYQGLPREDQGSPLACVHGHDCQEEAVWFVWYARAGGLYTYLCHDHLIEQLRGVAHNVVQIKRTPRWEPVP